jgi:hypothetical protein
VAGHAYSPETQFQPGQRVSPRTEFKPGERTSVATEFRPGGPAHNKLPIGTETIRLNKKLNQRRAWVKVDEPNVWKLRAVLVWESLHGPVPKGHVVHHEDRDTLNDDPANLEVITKREHLIEHRSEMKNTRRIEFRGETRTLAEWCRFLSLPANTIQWRIEANWSAEKALTTPVRRANKNLSRKL